MGKQQRWVIQAHCLVRCEGQGTLRLADLGSGAALERLDPQDQAVVLLGQEG